MEPVSGELVSPARSLMTREDAGEIPRNPAIGRSQSPRCGVFWGPYVANSLSAVTGKSAAMNTDSRGENRVHEWSRTTSTPQSPMLLYRRRWRPDRKFRECPLLSGRCSRNACTPDRHETQRGSIRGRENLPGGRGSPPCRCAPAAPALPGAARAAACSWPGAGGPL